MPIWWQIYEIQDGISNVVDSISKYSNISFFCIKSINLLLNKKLHSFEQQIYQIQYGGFNMAAKYSLIFRCFCV